MCADLDEGGWDLDANQQAAAAECPFANSFEPRRQHDFLQMITECKRAVRQYLDGGRDEGVGDMTRDVIARRVDVELRLAVRLAVRHGADGRALRMADGDGGNRRRGTVPRQSNGSGGGGWMMADGQCWSEASAADDQHCEHWGEDLQPSKATIVMTMTSTAMTTIGKEGRRAAGVPWLVAAVGGPRRGRTSTSPEPPQLGRLPVLRF